MKKSRMIKYIPSILLVFLGVASAVSQVKEQPNIIFILTDDQRFDAVGYAGNPLSHTPAMDRLAREGTFFDHAMVTTPICAASRASIFTSLYERTHNFNFQTGDIRESYMQNAYPRLLREGGYQTAFFGKYGIRYPNLDALFDVYESYDRNNAFKDSRGYYYKTLGTDTVHLTRYTGQKALDFIARAANEKQPFCLSLSFSAPHAHDPAEDQYYWQEETAHLLKDTKVPDPALGEDIYFESLPEKVRAGFNRTRWHWRYDTPEKYQHSVKGYHRMISGIDLEIEKIRDKLVAEEMDQNTIIILMGDNGYFLGERQLAGKWLMYDNSVRVPLIVYDPRVENQADNSSFALNVDVPATILDAAGLSIPTSWQGQSLLPFLSSNKQLLERDTVLIEHLWEFDNIPPSEGVRTANWKYFRYINDPSIEELYDLDSDPQEKNNLAKDQAHGETLSKLRKSCERLIREHSDAYRQGPTDLMIEFIRSPANVPLLDSKPEYSWVVASGSAFQSAYQILVASSLENLAANIGDIWNSNQVRSSKSTNIEHQGKDLQPGATYHWKVRIWDEDNRLVDYSASQSFTMGEQQDVITTPNKFGVEYIPAKSVSQINDDLLIDFGKDAFATMEFEFASANNQSLIVRLGEQLTDGRINTEPQGHIRYQEIEVPIQKGTHHYQVQVHVDERNTKPQAVALPDSFPVLMPFRYAEILGTQKADVKNPTQVAYFSYWEDDQSAFESSNDILNQIWDLCKYSIKATTFAGLYVDGDRERIPYEADAYLNQLSHYTTDREYPIARQTIEYFMENPTWPTEWQQHVALMFYADYQYTGNTELIAKYYDELKHKTLMELRREDGLVSSTKSTPEFMKKLGFKDPDAKLKDIVDWPPAQKDTGWKLATKEGERDGFVFMPISTVINALYYQNMMIMAEFAEVLGKTEEALEFEFLAAQAKQSVNTKLFDKKRGVYVDGEGTDHASLHANMMPLAFNMVPSEHIPSVVEFVKSRGMACSVYGSQYLMDGLYNAGEEDYALELLTKTDDRSWYNMIRIGSTISLEAWDMKYKPNADWNHAWGAAPANVIPRGLWGIQPIKPGFEIARIRPQMSTLKSSQIEVPTIRGNIKAEYKHISNRRQTYRITIPANMVAEFELPATGEKVVKLNSKKVNLSFGNIRLLPGEHLIEVVINSF